MCGIAGVVPLNGGAAAVGARLSAMCATIVHRGPDDEGCDIRDGIAIGMRRLSIIDVAGGHQPIFNEDRSVRVVFNGEIYNYRELRAELVAAGHRFTTASDTEVLVHLWEEHGTGFAARLNGMFAIALHDSRRRPVRAGARSLRHQAAVLRGDAAAPGLRLRSEGRARVGPLRPDARRRRAGPVPLLGVRPRARHAAPGRPQARPGGDAGGGSRSSRIERHTWWRLPAADSARTARCPARSGEWEEAVDAKVRESVRRQLVSDVPLGAFLSGGVDSSLVVAAMGPARTFSIGFDDPELQRGRLVEAGRRLLGVTHSVEIIRPDVVGLFEHLMQFMDDPIGDFSIFPTYLVSRLARREVTVVLSGDGGDEVFGGYETYAAQEKARTWRRIPGCCARHARAADRRSGRDRRRRAW